MSDIKFVKYSLDYEDDLKQFVDLVILEQNDPNVSSFKDHFYENLYENKEFILWLCLGKDNKIIGTTAAREFRSDYYKKVFKIDPEKYSFNNTKELCSDFIAPVLRGNHFQYSSILFREKKLQTNYKYAAATILDTNTYSINNYLQSGYKIISEGSSTWSNIKVTKKFVLLIKEI